MLDQPLLTQATSFGSASVHETVPEADRLAWKTSFERYAADHRYYDLVRETLGDQFAHRYLILRDGQGVTRAVQPFLVIQQDLITGTPAFVRNLVEKIRRHFPSFLKLKMLMVGCSAGEGDIAFDQATGSVAWVAGALKEALPPVARKLKTMLIVFKDMPRFYREFLDDLQTAGFTRIPSMPATRLELTFSDFEEYLRTRLSHAMRKNLRRKFRKSENGDPIELSVETDISQYVDDLYPLYRQTLSRSEFKFEELTKSYLCELGRRLPDRAKFLIWRKGGKIVAFASCVVHDGVLKDNYIGLDYSVALDYHLYFVTWRDTVIWALKNGVRIYHSAPLNYDPKYHFRMDLEPLDLYVRSPQGWLNPIFRLVLPFLEPTRYDRTVQKFANRNELW
jgi:hypothetical protein